MTEPDPHICATCNRCWFRDDGNVGCGAPLDDGALAGGEGVNPIWAERKYGRATILRLLTGGEMPSGTDCENLSAVDGAECKMWRAHADTPPDHVLQDQAKHLPAVCERVAATWMADPSTIPRGVRIDVRHEVDEIQLGGQDRLALAGDPKAGFIEAAADYVAPGWEWTMARYAGAAQLVVGRYTPRSRR